MGLLNYKNCVAGLLAVALTQTVALADPGEGKKKAVRIPNTQIHYADSTPTTIDLRDLGWDAFQPFWRPQTDDLRVDSFDFEDKSALERLTKLRSLSLVTFAETSNTRLFLGINDDGMVGLHFSAFPRHGKDRHLSLWSMPYVEANKDEDNAQKVDLTSENSVVASDDD